MDRLIALHRLGIAPIAFHVHDGYVLLATKQNYKQVYIQARDVLQAEGEFSQGLHLRVNCKAGRNLNDLKSLIKKGVQNKKNEINSGSISNQQ